MNCEPVRLKLNTKMRVKERKVKSHNTQIIEKKMISIFYDAVVGVGKVKNSNLSAMLKENTLSGIKTYL